MESSEGNFKNLQAYQKKWNEIGHVPLKDKDRLNQEFRNLINHHFDSLNMDEFHKNVEKFRNKIENYRTGDYTVITSYSIHYTKLYELLSVLAP